ncbi:GGDEF domain-containing protein [Shewanella gaetbuli]|uniref:GGDEF domain-containing protein n=1 Tax=Shewanella gaetbuli TaxID=220752 RepID=A0A9X2CJJ0_9GAMM|nr:GGDEF domain-containing protein [Shewanella gaetbuli]MCL1144182.1 GGDEF domain-containing protein [Shewanella gaetbuli]
MTIFSRFDLRQKTIAATIILVVVLLSITLLSLSSFSTTQAKLEKVTSQYQPKMLSALQLTSHFYHSLSVLGNYLIEKDNLNMTIYQAKVNDINDTLNRLVNLTNLNPELDDAEQLIRIRALVDEIIAHNIRMLDLAQNNNKNMPALGIASDKLEPIAISMNHIVNDLLLVTEENDQDDITPLIENLRFNWVMLVSDVRNFLAFRQKNILFEIRLFTTGVNQSFEDLTKLRSKMDADQQDLLDEFEHSFSLYRGFLTQAISVHSSNDWRADRLLMRQEITPTLRKLNLELESLVTKQQQRIQESNQELAKQIIDAERTIRISIQIALAIAVLVIILSFRNKRLARDVVHHANNAQKLRHKANHDALTKLANRANFDETLELLLTEEQALNSETSDDSQADNQPQSFIGLLFIDLDGFKAVNDNVGHDAGDFILARTAKRMKTLVRTSDLVCRLGGDEFAIILNQVIDISTLSNVANKVCKSIDRPYVFKGKKLNVSASIGISYSIHPNIIQHQNMTDKMALMIKQADEAMYQAKNKGKNQYCLYS